MTEQKETKNPVQSAERIFQVMEMLADHGEMGLMEISTALGLHKSTVHRLLMSLVYMGYALDDEENEEGVCCIAASLRDYHNEVKYAFSISGPASRMTRERMEELSADIRNVQEELSMELGWYRK